MKKVCSLLILLFLCLSLLNAVDERLSFVADVPDDFGVNIPSDSVRLDRLVFALDSEFSDLNYLASNNDLYIGDVTKYPEGITLNLLYYGNLSYPYDVVISTNSGRGLSAILEGDATASIPLFVKIEESEELSDGVAVSEIDENNTRLTIDPTGLRQGDNVLDVNINWDASATLLPGRYHADLSFELTSI